ncbi:hypothetical protein [Roseiconus lacunae]|uniref:Uncharacterized protein n=1 Tax=Roseiconus lacunae TaxID=2605694 RepID=A0ABT7PSA9_9BACT|nr:hypothetical protein [Roseiconus lacunae]MDM4019394.1 hypothetical protein [Roseiconus lacunae]
MAKFCKKADSKRHSDGQAEVELDIFDHGIVNDRSLSSERCIGSNVMQHFSGEIKVWIVTQLGDDVTIALATLLRSGVSFEKWSCDREKCVQVVEDVWAPKIYRGSIG